MSRVSAGSEGRVPSASVFPEDDDGGFAPGPQGSVPGYGYVHTYIPQKQTASTSIYEVLAAAEDLFRDGIAVQDRFFAVRSMNEELIGPDNDGGRLTLTVQYYDSADETEAAERMKVLHQRYRGKETTKYENAIH